MKQFLIIASAVLVGALAALLLYDRFVLAPRTAEQADGLRASVKVDLAQARDDAEAIAKGLDDAVDRSIAGANRALDAESAERERRRLVQDAVGRAAMIKVAATEYFLSMGRWPKHAKEAGLGPPESYAGGAVQRIDLDAKGAIAIVLADTFAPGGRIHLTPSVDPQSYIVNWTCRIEHGDDLRRHVPGCE